MKIIMKMKFLPRGINEIDNQGGDGQDENQTDLELLIIIGENIKYFTSFAKL